MSGEKNNYLQYYLIFMFTLVFVDFRARSRKLAFPLTAFCLKYGPRKPSCINSFLLVKDTLLYVYFIFILLRSSPINHVRNPLGGLSPERLKKS